MCSFNQQITECQGLLLAGGGPPAAQQAASGKWGAIPRVGAIPKMTESSRIPGADRWYKCWGFSEPWHRAWHPVDATTYLWNRWINELKKKKKEGPNGVEREIQSSQRWQSPGEMATCQGVKPQRESPMVAWERMFASLKVHNKRVHTQGTYCSHLGSHPGF